MNKYPHQQKSNIPRQLLRMTPRTWPGARQSTRRLVLDIRAQRLDTASLQRLDIDPRELEVITRRRGTAVKAGSYVIPSCARDVLPPDVGDGDAGGVAVGVRVCLFVLSQGQALALKEQTAREGQVRTGKGRDKEGREGLTGDVQIQEVTYMGWLTFSKWMFLNVTFRTYPRPG